MRITPNITSQNSLHNIQNARTLLNSINEKISSGKNYNRPSDDPVAAHLLTGIADKLRSNEQYKSNIDKANISMAMTDTVLVGLNKTMSTIKGLVATVTGTELDATAKQNAVTQLTALREQLADFGNTQVDKQFIFAGTDTTKQPFSRSVQLPPYAASYYDGNGLTSNVEIDQGAEEKKNLPGNQVLTGPDVNILKSMDQLIDTLQNDPTNRVAIQARANELENGAAQIQKAQITNATRISRLDMMSTMLGNTRNSLHNVVANVQNADYAKLAVELQQQTLAFEATLSSTAKVTRLSLLDYL